MAHVLSPPNQAQSLSISRQGGPQTLGAELKRFLLIRSASGPLHVGSKHSLKDEVSFVPLSPTRRPVCSTAGKLGGLAGKNAGKDGAEVIINPRVGVSWGGAPGRQRAWQVEAWFGFHNPSA